MILFELDAASKPPQENLPRKEVLRISVHKVKDRFSEKLNEIKKEKCDEKRLEKLEEICCDKYSLDDAIEIAKHNTSIIQPTATLIMAMTAVFLNFFPDPYFRAYILIIGIAIVWFLVAKEFDKWNIVYFDLIELRRKKRGKWDESEGYGSKKML